MTNTNLLSVYQSLNQSLAQQQIGVTATELHGLISGILCGGNQDESWLPLVYSLTNEDQAYTRQLEQQVKALYEATKAALADENFSFQLLIPEDENSALFDRIDDLSGWVNHFLLGLGIVVTTLDKVKGDIGEVIDDLRGIGQLGYEEEDDPEELEQALTEVSEYVRMAAMLCYNEFNSTPNNEDDERPTLH
jgi:yecA family protein